MSASPTDASRGTTGVMPALSSAAYMSAISACMPDAPVRAVFRRAIGAAARTMAASVAGPVARLCEISRLRLNASDDLRTSAAFSRCPSSTATCLAAPTPRFRP